MKRLIHIFVVVSILFTQSAWAFHDLELDTHPEHFQSQQIEHSDHDDVSAHNHCGHSSAHFVGVFNNVNNDFYSASNNNVEIFTHLTSSISYQPPTPPPIS